MTRTIRSGKVIERSKFFAGKRRPRKSKKGSSSLAQKDRNMNTAVRQLARVANCNMGPSWLFLSLTYSDEHLPAAVADAWKEVTLFIRRMKRRGMPVKGFWITADKHKDGTPARLHHHMVIDGSGVDPEELQQIWGKGFVHCEPAKDQGDYTPVAAYLVRQAADEPGRKKWRCSLGLEKPVIESEEITDKEGEIHIPAGADVQEIGHYDEQTGSQYVRYIRKEKTAPAKLYAGFDWQNGPYAKEIYERDEL